MKIIKLSLLLFISVLVLEGCANKKVTRIDPQEQTDLSGRWNDTDSRLVSNEMIADCIERPWRSRFTDAKGKVPTIIIGDIKNNTSEIIPIETFIKDMEKAFINTGTVDVVQSGEFRDRIREERDDQQTYSNEETRKEWGNEYGADFMLNGVMTSITDQEGRDKVVFYQINLELTDLETNKKVWIGDKKIKKAIRN
ncbi:MAG: hypothetical protein ACJAZ3_001329 [Sphingobacteriales bacterium]|jgi:uncharacterized protein (TIGR02722 family)